MMIMVYLTGDLLYHSYQQLCQVNCILLLFCQNKDVHVAILKAAYQCVEYDKFLAFQV